MVVRHHYENFIELYQVLLLPYLSRPHTRVIDYVRQREQDLILDLQEIPLEVNKWHRYK